MGICEAPDLNTDRNFSIQHLQQKGSPEMGAEEN
jgi:hypothetical protein